MATIPTDDRPESDRPHRVPEPTAPPAPLIHADGLLPGSPEPLNNPLDISDLLYTLPSRGGWRL